MSAREAMATTDMRPGMLTAMRMDQEQPWIFSYVAQSAE